MPAYDIRPLQLRLLDIALAFHDVCLRHGLRYYMIDGTLIGAVRHRGFIPWDDDMDLAMPRPDYEVLTAHAREWLPAPLEFVSHDTDPDYPLHFGKIQDASTTLVERPHLYYLGGAYIDIFPIDGAPASALSARIHNVRYQTLRKLLYFRCRDPYRHGHGPSSWLPLTVRALRSHDGIQADIRAEMTRYPFETSERVAVNLNDGLPSIVNRVRTLGDPTPVEFEGHRLMGMADNHTYLSAVFGDYMTPPPAAGRHVHNFHYLDLTRPYREYTGCRR